MKTLYNIVALILFSCSLAWAQNVEFEKSNFPDKKDLLKEAKRSLDDGITVKSGLLIIIYFKRRKCRQFFIYQSSKLVLILS
jgi:hypothetical protein